MTDRKTITVEGPANIAFVKYWGKQGRQYPMNPSVSMTLKHCLTTCRISYQSGRDDLSLESYTFAGQENDKFKSRIAKYLHDISDVCPILKQLSLSIETENTFPHSAGIASSASAFASIGYALAHIERALGRQPEQSLEHRASFLARLGSGSAGRSIEGPYTIWGEFAEEKSVNDYACGLEGVHADFFAVKDAILLIDTDEKKVSSSAGHALMDKHPFRESRIQQAEDHTSRLMAAMRAGDWEVFGDIVENEALTLHAMMMTSSPSYVLMAPHSLSVIDKVRDFRRETKLPVYFTIDAGPNIHLIYPQSVEARIEEFIQSDLVTFCHDNKYIIDECGKGARVINT